MSMFANVFLVCACVLLCEWVRVETTRLVTHAQVYQTSLAFRKELQAEQSSVVKTFEKRLATYEALSDKVVCVCVCACACVEECVCACAPTPLPTSPFALSRVYSLAGILSHPSHSFPSTTFFPGKGVLDKSRGAPQDLPGQGKHSDTDF